jgi:adenosyl cobinamide kinase/adenosyl cobinamide phosphate guanylyltransferase
VGGVGKRVESHVQRRRRSWREVTALFNAKLAAQAPQQMQELAGLVEKQAEELGCSESG